jgi:hypothetical protein
VVKTPAAVSKLLDWMRQEHLTEISPASFPKGSLNYLYKLTDAGEDRAKEALERSQYVGPAPVPIHFYNQAIQLQTQGHRKLNFNEVTKVLSELILDPDFHRRIGPAVNSSNPYFSMVLRQR